MNNDEIFKKGFFCLMIKEYGDDLFLSKFSLNDDKPANLMFSNNIEDAIRFPCPSSSSILFMLSMAHGLAEDSDAAVVMVMENENDFAVHGLKNDKLKELAQLSLNVITKKYE
jgi:hypothetical protein